MEVAEPVLRAIGARLSSSTEVIVVPGNHDGELIAPWLRANGVSPALDAPIPLDATPLLARLAAWLRPGDVRVRYPGVWLAEGVWATHGHYLDRHLLPETAFGVARGLLGRLPHDGARPVDYERAGGPSLTRLEARLTRWLPRPLAGLVDDVAELLRAGTMPRGAARAADAPDVADDGEGAGRADAPRQHPRAGAGGAPTRGRRRPGRVRPRASPRTRSPGEDEQIWLGPGGRPRIINTGSWVYEPLLVHHASPPHPYWPGGAVMLETGGEPVTIGLLDHLEAAALH